MGFEAIILGAGYSSRAQGYKMTFDIEGKTLIERCIEGFLKVCERVIVVGGYRIEMIDEVLKDYDKVKLVKNEDFQRGMFSSIQRGIKEIEEDSFFICPGDYPLISKDVFEKIMAARGQIIIPSFNGGRGHPILIHSSIKKEILEEHYSSNLREFIRNKEITLVEIDKQLKTWDIDTREDLQVTRQHFKLLLGGEI